jgi:hypothetical protein
VSAGVTLHGDPFLKYTFPPSFTQFLADSNSVLFALLGFALADEVMVFLNNNDAFDVSVREAIGQYPDNGETKQCVNFSVSKEGKLSAGGGVLGIFPVYQDSCGHSGKSLLMSTLARSGIRKR